MTLTCYCCGTVYERGQFRCCAPPNNMTSAAWLEKFCKVCSGDADGLRTKCPKHCTCPKQAVVGLETFGAFSASGAAANPVQAARAAVAERRPTLSLVKPGGFSRFGGR